MISTPLPPPTLSAAQVAAEERIDAITALMVTNGGPRRRYVAGRSPSGPVDETGAGQR